MILNAVAYTEALELARLTIFDPNKHPRGWHGRFRKGQRVKLLGGGTGKIVGIDHAAGKAKIETKLDSGKMYVTERQLQHVIPAAEKPLAAKDVRTAADAQVYGLHKGMRLELGDKLNTEAIQHIVRAIDSMPELNSKRDSTRDLKWVAAMSTIAPHDPHGLGPMRAHIDKNPKIVMLHDPGMTGQRLVINDVHRAEQINSGDMRALTNPLGDKHVSGAHATFEGIVQHELGHVVYESASSNAWDAGDKEYKARVDQAFHALGPDWIDKHLSYQAAKSPVEFFAEAYALLRTPGVEVDPAVREKLGPVIG